MSSTLRLHLDDAGSGTALLLLHGRPSTVQVWDPVVESLRGRHRVLVAHLPGYGRSPALEGRYSFERVGVAIEDALLERGVDEVAVVGFSGGAYRAIGLALSGRVRVTSLMTLGGVAGHDAAGGDAFLDLARLVREGFDFLPTWLARMAAPGFEQRHPDEVAGILSWIDATSREVLASEFEAMAIGEDYRSRLPELAMPVVARVGELDAATPAELSRVIATGAPRGVLQIVPGCGHALLAEDRVATLEAIRMAVSAT